MQLDDVPLVDERSVVALSAATVAEAEIATAKGYFEGVDTEAAREVYPS
jgi:hypothetical protein